MIRLSLIIATFNRSEQLLTTLHSVAAQSGKAEVWECIVVDNNSSDDTAEAVAKFIASHPTLNIHYCFEPQQGLSHARNRGIVESKGDIIAFVDDDETIVEEFVREYVALFDSHPEAMAAGGRIVPEYISGEPKWMSHYVALPIANPLDYGDYVRKFPRGKHPGGGNMAVRREVIERIGAFDTELGRTGERLIGGEECDFFERMYANNMPIYYVPRAAIYHRIGSDKLTDDYTSRLFHQVGVSQRIRAKRAGRLSRAYVAEVAKWGVTLLLCLIHTPARSRYLIRLRRGISRGLFGR
jgi:glycosyltransferase involved in cell wall biosynthesis